MADEEKSRHNSKSQSMARKIQEKLRVYARTYSKWEVDMFPNTRCATEAAARKYCSENGLFHPQVCVTDAVETDEGLLQLTVTEPAPSMATQPDPYSFEVETFYSQKSEDTKYQLLLKNSKMFVSADGQQIIYVSQLELMDVGDDGGGVLDTATVLRAREPVRPKDISVKLNLRDQPAIRVWFPHSNRSQTLVSDVSEPTIFKISIV